MARLNDKHRTLLVQSLAAFSTPSEARDELKEVYGVDAGLDQVVFYNPTTANGARLADKWKTMFAEARARFRRDTDDIAVANKAFRLRELNRIVRTTKSPKLKMEAMEQAAKEMGDVYTNRRVHSGTLQIDWGALSDDQLDRIAEGDDPADVLASADRTSAPTAARSS